MDKYMLILFNNLLKFFYSFIMDKMPNNNQSLYMPITEYFNNHYLFSFTDSLHIKFLAFSVCESSTLHSVGIKE